ncbi:MAG: hypothetical protein ICV64_10635 [Thermoleophilia bacterium]|nr:hypothetical protein [Thermoleophilia bacterium]
MIGTATSVSPEEAVWWQGALMKVKARGEETGGAFALADHARRAGGDVRDAGVPAAGRAEPPEPEYDAAKHADASAALARKYGFEVVGPPLA